MAEIRPPLSFTKIQKLKMDEEGLERVAFREILDNLPIAIYITDAEGHLVYFNSVAAELSGRKPQLGTDLWCISWKLYSPDGTPMSHDECPMAVALKEGRAITDEEIIMERPDGKRAWIAPFPSPIYNQEGKLIGGVNTLLDLTDRKENEHFDALLGAIVEGSDDAIVSKNLDGIITSWNSSAERIFGYSESEIVGKPVTVLIPDDRLEEETAILGKLKQGERVEHFETIRIRKDGTSLHVSLTISPIRDSRGQVIGASKIARDITARKQAEKELQTLNETLELRVEKRTAALLAYQDQLRFLTSELSKAEESERQRLATDLHDNLGQILALSKVKLDLLLRNHFPDQTRSDIVELSDLMNSAITYTRELMTDLKPPPSLEKENLVGNIGWVINKMEKHNLEVTLEEDDQPKSLTEEVRRTLCKCVRELLFNVIKHAGTTKARIAISRVDKQIQIIVEDNGKGFNMKEKIPFPTQQGGFGLFSIHERMNWMGGDMEIDSKPGEGTKVKLLAPVAGDDKSNIQIVKNDHADNALQKPDAKVQTGKKIKVLLVDDHQMVRRGLKNLIEEQEDLVVIAEATNGNDAIKLAQEANPEVIVMDINMPEMNGIKATQIISSKKLPVSIIGLSLHDNDDVKEAMHKAGASGYLTKTEAFESLSALIRSEAMVARKAAEIARLKKKT